MFAVTITHNFDYDTRTVLFEDLARAEAYLHWWWEQYYNEEIANNSDLNEKECYHEADCYAKVTWSDGYYTEFFLSEVEEYDREFDKVNIRRYL